ncbi:uncharacterized protein DNG_01135 [Cephalotrichum gorgonifer]|uniref:Uncharacterized protein n=1 Tax=Cephalotrichum gorgonifer TaxID=2041049 RepID=A0AAE8MS27_9PEZI|nr:uncharacterized protein DNG_01135 [Cephalotrichum gorgonifer]
MRSQTAATSEEIEAGHTEEHPILDDRFLPKLVGLAPTIETQAAAKPRPSFKANIPEDLANIPATVRAEDRVAAAGGTGSGLPPRDI